MDIDKKLQEFKQSLDESATRDYNQIEQNVEEEIKSGIEQELLEYEAKKNANYEKNAQKIEKDFNKKLFNYEMQCKKEIIDEEKRLKNEIKKESITILKKFTQSPDYQSFLINCIKERNGANSK